MYNTWVLYFFFHFGLLSFRMYRKLYIFFTLFKKNTDVPLAHNFLCELTLTVMEPETSLS
jgi:hypothetical protein